VLSLILLVDSSLLVRRILGGGSPGEERRARAGLAVAAGLALLAVIGVKRAELAGRLVEVSQPYRGPLDSIIPALRERYADTRDLRIATNYEAEAYMYYLGSRVVGRFHAGTEEADAAERSVTVDVVIPRKRQPRSFAQVRGYLEQGRFVEHGLPVADLPYNNIPELYRGRVLDTTHLFRTQRSPGGRGSVSYFIRSD